MSISKVTFLEVVHPKTIPHQFVNLVVTISRFDWDADTQDVSEHPDPSQHESRMSKIPR